MSKSRSFKQGTKQVFHFHFLTTRTLSIPLWPRVKTHSLGYERTKKNGGEKKHFLFYIARLFQKFVNKIKIKCILSKFILVNIEVKADNMNWNWNYKVVTAFYKFTELQNKIIFHFHFSSKIMLCTF